MTPSALESALAKLRAHTDLHISYAIISHEEAAALLARLEAADELVEFLVNLRADSTGVAGYHLNGDIAEWDEFEEMNLLATYHNPAPAGSCTTCGGEVHHREGKPGEFDHQCNPAPAAEGEKS